MASQTSQWPMIILRSGLDGSEKKWWCRGLLAITKCLCGDGEQADCPSSSKWMKSYKPEEAFNENGKLIDELAEQDWGGDNLMLTGHLAERPEDA